MAAFEREFDEGNREIGVILALHDLGRVSEFESRFSRLRDALNRAEPIARIYAWTGNADTAFAWLDKAIEQDGPGIFAGIDTPLYEKILLDPRWRELRKRQGLLDGKEIQIEFDQSLLPR